MRKIKPIHALVGAATLALVAGGAVAESTMSDEELAAKIQQEIMNSAELNEVQIDVAAENGTVTLTGLVEDDEQLTAIENILDGMEGVDNVENNLILQ